MTRKPERFTTGDGSEFTDEAEAKEWEGVLEAKKECDRAGGAWLRKLAATTKTADGSLFDPDKWRFYRVETCDLGMPRMIEASERLQYYIDGGEVCVEWRGQDSSRYPIRELYQKKKAAQRAVLAAIDEYLGWCQEDRATLVKEIGE